MIKLVLYDADGVLIHTELATIELERRFRISRNTSAEFFANEWDEILIGKADTKEKLAPYLKKWGWRGSVEDYQKFWFEFEHKIDQRIIDHIQKLRNRGVICAVATNQDKYRANYMLEKMGFGQSFDFVHVSAHLGASKPTEQFFKLILAKHQVAPSEVVFWDDQPSNIKTARNLGIIAKLYTDFEEYKFTMNELILGKKD